MPVRRVLAWSAALIVLVVSLAPLPGPPAGTPAHSDKLVHAALYALLALLFVRAHPQHRRLLIGAALTAYGAAIELLQHFAPGRMASFADGVANFAGISIMLAYAARRARPRRRHAPP